MRAESQRQERPRRVGGGSKTLSPTLLSRCAGRRGKQRLEHVDEVQIERQRAEDALLLRDLVAVALEIHVLDVLRVPGGEAGEDQNGQDRQGELQAARLQEQVDQARDHQTPHAHHEERAECRQVALRHIAVEAQAAEGRRRDEEYAGDGYAGEHISRSTTSTGPSPPRRRGTGCAPRPPTWLGAGAEEEARSPAARA